MPIVSRTYGGGTHRLMPEWTFVRLYLFIVSGGIWTYCGFHMEFRGQLPGVNCLFPPCGSQGWNTSHYWPWQQAPLPTAPSCQATCLGYSLAINYCHLLFEKVMLTCYDILFLSLSPHLMYLISDVLWFKTHPSWVWTLPQPEAMRSLVKYFSYDSVSSGRKQK